jgi:VanZ family protein
MFKVILYRTIFWLLYLALLIYTFMPVSGNLSGSKAMSLIRMDYFLHFMVYFLFCLYYLFGQKLRMPLFRDKSLLKFVIAVFFLASVTEILQIRVPGRTFNPFDWIANVAGLASGVILILIARLGKPL